MLRNDQRGGNSKTCISTFNFKGTSECLRMLGISTSPSKLKKHIFLQNSMNNEKTLNGLVPGCIFPSFIFYKSIRSSSEGNGFSVTMLFSGLRLVAEGNPRESLQISRHFFNWKEWFTYPQNGALEDDFPFQTGDFQVL